MQNPNPNNLLALLPQIPYSPGTILLAVRGSLAHGMYVGGTDGIDDKDFMGVVLPTFEERFSLRDWHSRGTREYQQGEIDLVEYEITKLFSLLLKCNPNVLSLLWMKDEYYLLKTPLGQLLRDNRGLFSSRKAMNAFVGYGYGQIGLMRRSNRHGFRGAKREELIEKFGYDCKNAAHAVRLLRMGIEFLQTGILNVNRTDIDAGELLSIKRGEWKLEVIEEAANTLISRLHSSVSESPLPEEPDREGALQLMRGMIASAWMQPGGQLVRYDTESACPL